MSSVAARGGAYLGVYYETPDALEHESRSAQATVDQGVEIATRAGLDAAGRSLSANGPIWATLIDAIEEIRPRLVVMGSRGLTGLRSAFVGSVSHAVSSHAHVPVLIIPHDAPLEAP
jgi:nucleotide-binding universal stress UspA family protein